MLNRQRGRMLATRTGGNEKCSCIADYVGLVVA
jgi:hypothetical protein